MLRWVFRFLRAAFFGVAVVCLVWLPVSFFIYVYVTWPGPQRDAGVSFSSGSVWVWHERGSNPNVRRIEEGVNLDFEDASRNGFGPAVFPWYERREWQTVYSPMHSVELRLPLWLLAAICLAWPVTSLLLARRRRKGRGFAVEPAADAAPPAIDLGGKSE